MEREGKLLVPAFFIITAASPSARDEVKDTPDSSPDPGSGSRKREGDPVLTTVQRNEVSPSPDEIPTQVEGGSPHQGATP